jgi:mannosyltransferase
MNGVFPDLVTKDPPAEPAGRRLARVYWAWPAALTLVLSAYQLTRPALWADELATWGAVQLRWGALFRLLGNVDAVVGPYLALMKAWTSVAGSSTLALRLPSVLAMTAATALLAILGARLAGPRVGLLAGLAFAVVPTTSRYAQEARPYAFVILFAILATLALTWLLDRPAWPRAVLYGGAVALLGAFHLVALLLLVAHGIVVGLRRDRARLIAWGVAAGAAILMLLPLAWLGHRQSAQISWLTPADWRTLVAVPDTIFGAGVVGGLLIALGLLAVSRRPAPAAVLAGCWALAPILALYLVSELTTLFWARYLLFTLPGFVLLAALALSRLRPAGAAAFLVVLALLAAPAQTGIRTPDGHNHATTAAAGIIAANEREGDGIAYALDEPVVPWEARDIVARYVPAGKRPRDVFALTPQRVDGHLTATECPDLASCLDGTPRLWVLRYQNLADPLAGIGPAKEDLLRSRYRLEKLWLPRGLTVALYVRS